MHPPPLGDFGVCRRGLCCPPPSRPRPPAPRPADPLTPHSAALRVVTDNFPAGADDLDSRGTATMDDRVDLICELAAVHGGDPELDVLLRRVVLDADHEETAAAMVRDRGGPRPTGSPRSYCSTHRLGCSPRQRRT